MVAIVEQVRQSSGNAYEAVCRELDVPYSSLMRWKGRYQAGKVLVQRPGPAKVEPLNVGSLALDILRLRYGRERAGGTRELYERYREQISRRDLQSLVEAIRRELRREELALMRRVDWRVPGLVWSVDDAELEALLHGKGKIHLVRDLGSRYVLRSLGDEVMQKGEKVADNLAI